MTTTQINTAELSGAALCWAVNKSEHPRVSKYYSLNLLEVVKGMLIAEFGEVVHVPTELVEGGV